MSIEQVLSVILPFLPFVGITVVVLVFLLSTIKVANGNEVLVVTGLGATRKSTRKNKVKKDGQEVEVSQVTYVPTIKIAGAAFVIPFIQRASKFDVCVKKANKDKDSMKTQTGVEIEIDWGISYAPNADDVDTLQSCIRQFLDKDEREVEEIIMNSVAGGMRAVISTMTPQQVMVGKESLDEAVQKNIADQMLELGYKVQIYIQEVRDVDKSSYYRDLAAKDREETRQKAAEITADAEKAVRERKASTDQAAKQAELDAEVAIAEKQRDTDLKKSKFKAETEQAAADAEIAKQLQETERRRDLAAKEGAIEVEKQEQAQKAAVAEQAVRVTQAETAQKEAVIKANMSADTQRINAEAAAKIAETKAQGEAKAAKLSAEGQADAVRLEAQGKSDAVKLEAEADAERIAKVGEAEAKAIKAKGEAEADAIKAKGLAEAEAARKLSDAQAANDRVNFETTRLEIQRDMTIQVATSIAQVMANVGENATFYDFGGHATAGDGSDLLTRIMGNIPTLFAKANLQNQALNGQPLPSTIEDLMRAFAGPLGTALHGGVQTAPTAEPGDDAEAEVVDGDASSRMPTEANSGE